jgi:hypothetical protein
MARPRWVLQDAEIRKIVSLLFSTDMTVPEIAQRTGCSNSTILAINRKYEVREYSGRRNTWVVLMPEDRVRTA